MHSKPLWAFFAVIYAYFRQAHDAKGEDIRGETTLLELRRQYHCAAYNLMIAFISRTQTELKYYTAFLFEEKENKVSLYGITKYFIQK